MTFIPRDLYYDDYGLSYYLSANGFPNRKAIDWFQIQNFILSPSSLQDKKNRFDYWHKYVRENWDPTDTQYQPSQRIEDGRFTINVSITSGETVALNNINGNKYVRMWYYQPPNYDTYSLFPTNYASETRFRYGAYYYYYQLWYYPKYWQNEGYGDPRDFAANTREGRVVQALMLDDQRRLYLMATRYPWAPFMSELQDQSFWRVNYSNWQNSLHNYDYTNLDRRF